jgi:hypothetical protein
MAAILGWNRCDQPMPAPPPVPLLHRRVHDATAAVDQKSMQRPFFSQSP